MKNGVPRALALCVAEWSGGSCCHAKTGRSPTPRATERQKQQGAERLVVGGRRNARLVGQHVQERLRFRRTHVAWVIPAPAMPPDEEAHEVKVRFSV